MVGSNGKPCGAEISYTSSTSSLTHHLANVHGLQKGTPSKKQKTLHWGKAIGKSAQFPLNEKELMCVTWACNGLAYDLVDDQLFRRCFAGAIPCGMNRVNLSSEMIALADRHA